MPDPFFDKSKPSVMMVKRIKVNEELVSCFLAKFPIHYQKIWITDVWEAIHMYKAGRSLTIQSINLQDKKPFYSLKLKLNLILTS